LTKLIQEITVLVAIALFAVASTAYQLMQSATAQNMTGNQSSNQSVGLDLLPPRVVEDTQAEILGGQQ
jgi:hypothetical protein